MSHFTFDNFLRSRIYKNYTILCEPAEKVKYLLLNKTGVSIDKIALIIKPGLGHLLMKNSAVVSHVSDDIKASLNAETVSTTLRVLQNATSIRF